MCTVSWLHDDSGGYQLFCNRDERHTRRAALPPQIRERGGVKFIAPADGDFGGSWIGANQFGLSLCLLNRYTDETTHQRGNYTSRGLLLVELMDCRSRSHVGGRIAEMDLTRFRPFTLVALEPGAPVSLFQWTGRELLVESDGESRMPLASSSYDPTGVEEFRGRQFAQLKAAAGGVSADLLLAFHRSHAPEPGPWSACMHRDDAQTVSFSHLKVTPGGIEFYYQPQAPCLEAQAGFLRL
ncbi:MAG TPA: NRDE family protein [Blastocatellia bacterium]|nr:NRDE family protein [Blastocatellia bacterium]